MITGSGPGAGKSTLRAGLTERLGELGRDVISMGEEDLFAWPDFEDLAQRFRTKNFPGPDDLLAAFARAVLARLGPGPDLDPGLVLDRSG